MSQHRASKHRARRAHRAGRMLSRTMVAVAAGATVVTVSAGVALAGTAAGSGGAADFVASAFTTARGVVSRDDDRSSASKAALLDAAGSDGLVLTAREQVVADDARQFAASKMADYGWDGEQFQCLDSLWTKESHWRVNASNSSSGAYGIPQALPGSKMASIAADWQTNPETQVLWGLKYIQGRWGTPCDAWANSQAEHWY